jgi:hypothetical protein
MCAINQSVFKMACLSDLLYSNALAYWSHFQDRHTERKKETDRKEIDKYIKVDRGKHRETIRVGRIEPDE